MMIKDKSSSIFSGAMLSLAACRFVTAISMLGFLSFALCDRWMTDRADQLWSLYMSWEAGVSFLSVAMFFVFWMIWNDATGTTMDWMSSTTGIWLSLVASMLAVGFPSHVRKPFQTRELSDAIHKTVFECGASPASPDV